MNVRIGEKILESMKRENRDLEAALREIVDLVNRGQEGTTHWDGCEANHLRCRVAKVARAALAPEKGEAS